FYRQVVPLGLKKLHRSEMFVEKWKNSVFKAPSGRPVCFEKVNRTIMILLNKWLYFFKQK
ncbi:MAG: hypothetical protein Q8K04_00275, partial [Lutibacter sp.]|nr:hypothetical protein [Lutibacter sp.]